VKRPFRQRSCRLAMDDGFTLIETLVAAAVLVIGLIALYGFLDTTVKASFATRQREQATNVARQVLEDARSIPFAQISPGSIVSQLQAMPGLESKASGGWLVERGGTKYTIALKECPIDDGKGPSAEHPEDWGVHVNSAGENPFCKDAGEKEWKAGEFGPDSQPEDLKRITVDVTWTARGRAPDVHEVETVSAAEGRPGLNATGLRLESPNPEPGSPRTAPVIESPGVTSLTFSVSSPTGTAAMRWSLEGVPQSNPPTLKEGTTWTFSWAIPDPGVSDGTYNLAAQAIDAHGVLGPPVSIPVTLIRNVPIAVRSLKAGFNEVQIGGVYKRVVELEWVANEERNIVGYRVYRPTEGGEEAACATLSAATSCLDERPPPPNAKNLTYTVYALYRNAKSEVAQGSPATIRLATVAGNPPPKPNAPAELKAEKTESGAVRLTWSAPPAGGEPVVFYRIYRGSTEYASRYGLTAGTEREFSDTDATEPHKYWVTAVDSNMTESSPIGPVEK
jgi:prepilin-type N-terminal cleavage/methylation domain-containing protein